MFDPLLRFWEKFGELKDNAHARLGRDLLDSEEDALFIHHLRDRLGIKPAYDKWRLNTDKRHGPNNLKGGLRGALS